MSYKMHVTGNRVTFALAKQFAKDHGFILMPAYVHGTWFCFDIGRKPHYPDAAKAAKAFFVDVIVETTKERGLRVERFVMDFHS